MSVQESVTAPLGNGVLQVVHASGYSYDLSDPGAQQGDDHDDHNKVLDHSAACELVHDLKVLSGPLLMTTFPCPGSYLHGANKLLQLESTPVRLVTIHAFLLSNYGPVPCRIHLSKYSCVCRGQCSKLCKRIVFKYCLLYGTHIYV